MNIFKNIFSKKEELPLIDFSSIRCDIHSHLVPGIDDGSQTMEDTIRLIKVQYDLGIRKFITTPHIMSDFYKNTPEIILPGVEEIRNVLAQENLDVEIYGAAEYYFDEVFVRRIETEKLMTFGDNYLLFEISFINCPDNLKDTIFKMQLQGYKPILAHPERYPFFYNHFEEYRNIRDSGVLLQININSLGGYYGGDAKSIAEKLIDNKMVDLIGSDMHHMRHAECFQRVPKEKYFRKLLEFDLLNRRI